MRWELRLVTPDSFVCRQKSQVTPARTEGILFLGVQLQNSFCQYPAIVEFLCTQAHGKSSVSTGCKGSGSVGDHVSCRAWPPSVGRIGFSLANAKRARFSVFSPRLGQPPARLASQRIRTRTTRVKLSLFYRGLQSQPTKNLGNYYSRRGFAEAGMNQPRRWLRFLAIRSSENERSSPIRPSWTSPRCVAEAM